jgi:hypothetical protein
MWGMFSSTVPKSVSNNVHKLDKGIAEDMDVVEKVRGYVDKLPLKLMDVKVGVSALLASSSSGEQQWPNGLVVDLLRRVWHRTDRALTHFSLEFYSEGRHLFTLERFKEGMVVTQPDRTPQHVYQPQRAMQAPTPVESVSVDHVLRFVECQRQNGYNFVAQNCKHFCYAFWKSVLTGTVDNAPGTFQLGASPEFIQFCEDLEDQYAQDV